MMSTIRLRDQYRQRKADLLQVISGNGLSTRHVNGCLKQLSELADATLTQLWIQADLGPELCLVAVGGFGRQEQFPFSDIDVLVLQDADAQTELQGAVAEKISAFITSCWDAGLEIGSSVRTVQECLQESSKDVTVATALIESRYITGSLDLFKAFRDAFDQSLDARAFFTAKTLEMNQRHHKFEDTPYALEPNCKESPGGLRDLQVILWVAQAAGFGRSWDALEKNGLATPFEVSQIKRNEGLLRLIRIRLHQLAGRREDRLVFDLQTAVAESFQIGQGTSKKTHVRASELLMKRYYWAAKAVVQLNQILLLNIEERLNPAKSSLQPINEYFSDKSGLIEVNRDDLYQRHPQAILQTFLLYQSHSELKGLSARTLRALYNARTVMDAAFRQDPVNQQTFMRILMAREGITHALRLMNQTSVLGRYLWVFRRIVGQMQHDLFHVYTVDQHILMVLRNVRRFFMAEHAHEYPLCSQLAAGWDKPWILFAAALFHDIAKGRGGDHSELGAKEVRRFCQQHSIAAEDQSLIEFLVQEHLTMSRVAQKTDLSDPDVIAAFAKRVGSERYLTALYILTVADIRGTSPKVWNAWKGKLLEDLYRYTLRALGGYLPAADAHVESIKREALADLALHSMPHKSHEALWDTLDVSYFMRHDASDIAWHTRQLSRRVGTDAVVVRARNSLVGDGLQVMVYAKDQSDLFARICGYFNQAGLSILDARIHTSKNGYALDTFQLVGASGADYSRELASMIEFELAQAIAALGALPVPIQGRISRRVKSFPMTPRVSLKPDEKAQHWLLSISASDQSGLLYKVARTLAKHQVNLQLAKIATLGERVDDTFLIDGSALQNNRAQIAIEMELLDILSA
jgi:[protein-PII] uridylyltransferase